MKRTFLIIQILVAATVALTGCKHLYFDTENVPDPETEVRIAYTNPVIDRGFPDPSVIQGEDGWFYIYCSDEGNQNLPIYRSRNLVDWTNTGKTIFTSYNRPSWANTTNFGLWAPDIAKVGDKYVLYYALANFSNDDLAGGRNWGYGIGAAVASSPTGPFTDKGCILRSGEIRVQCSIDPCYYEDNGTRYLIWGSFFGLWAIELAEDGLSVKEGAEKILLAGSRGAAWGLEAAMVHYRDGFYYLFGSCNGTGYTENYQLTVYRSESFLGPYVARDGSPAINSHRVGETLIQGGSHWISPGHSSEIITDKAGEDWVFFHAYKNGDQSARRLLLEKISWVDGWPELGISETLEDGTAIKTPTWDSSAAPKFE
ncbi:MAG: family 43 glycosylhydrolase [Bacteroidales bacterium]|nr:family 43 glycosylhydrolase [Bacteroidales bacterium]